MTVARPIWMQAAGADTAIQYSAQELRAILSAIYKTEGVLPTTTTGLKVTQRGAGANFSVDVGTGYSLVQGDDVSNQGMYLVNISATENVPTPTAPGSGTRVHRVVLQVRDKLHNGSYTTYDAVPVLLQDTGTGTPALPASAISLALVSIAAGQASVTNANITDTRINAQMTGAVSDPTVVSSGSNATTGSVTFTTFVGSPLQITFTAPASGSVWVNVEAELEGIGTDALVYSFQIKNNNASGSTVVAADDRKGVQVQGPDYAQCMARSFITGLTPGNTYYLEDVVRSTTQGQVGSIFWRRLTVEPR